MNIQTSKLIQNWRKAIKVSGQICDSTLFILENKAAIYSFNDEKLKEKRKIIDDYTSADAENPPTKEAFDAAHDFIKKQIQTPGALKDIERINYLYSKKVKNLLSLEARALDINNKTQTDINDVHQIIRLYDVRNFFLKLLWDLEKMVGTIERESVLTTLSKKIFSMILAHAKFESGQDPKSWQTSYNSSLNFLSASLDSAAIKSSINESDRAKLQRRLNTETGQPAWEIQDEEIIHNLQLSTIEDEEYENAQQEVEEEESRLEELIHGDTATWNNDVFTAQERLKKAKQKRDKALEKYYIKHSFEKWVDDTKEKWEEGNKVNLISEGSSKLQKYIGSKIGENLAGGKSWNKGIKIEEIVKMGIESAESMFAAFPGGVILQSFISGLVTGWFKEEETVDDKMAEEFEKLRKHINEQFDQLRNFIQNRIDSLGHRSTLTQYYLSLKNVIESRQLKIQKLAGVWKQESIIDHIDTTEYKDYLINFNENCIYDVLSTAFGTRSLDKFTSYKASEGEIVQDIFNPDCLVSELKKYHQELPKEYPLAEFRQEVVDLQDNLKSYFVSVFIAKAKVQKIIAYHSFNVNHEQYNTEMKSEMFGDLLGDCQIEEITKSGKRNLLGRLNDAVDQTFTRLVGVKTNAVIKHMLDEKYFGLTPQYLRDKRSQFSVGVKNKNNDGSFTGKGARGLVLRKDQARDHIEQHLKLNNHGQGKKYTDRITGETMYLPIKFLICPREGFGQYGIYVYEEKQSLGIRPSYYDMASSKSYDFTPSCFYICLTKYNGCIGFLEDGDKNRAVEIRSASQKDGDPLVLTDKKLDSKQAFVVNLVNLQYSNVVNIEDLFPVKQSKPKKYLAHFIPGQKIHGNIKYYSKNERYYLIFDTKTCNGYIKSSEDDQIIWQVMPTELDPKAIKDPSIEYQTDGNLVIYSTIDGKRMPHSSTYTNGIRASEMYLDDQGILVIEHTLGGIWYSNVAPHLINYPNNQRYEMLVSNSKDSHHLRINPYDDYKKGHINATSLTNGSPATAYIKHLGNNNTPIYGFRDNDDRYGYLQYNEGDGSMEWYNNNNDNAHFYLFKHKTKEDKFVFVHKDQLKKSHYFNFHYNGRDVAFGMFENNPLNLDLTVLSFEKYH